MAVEITLLVVRLGSGEGPERGSRVQAGPELDCFVENLLGLSILTEMSMARRESHQRILASIEGRVRNKSDGLFALSDRAVSGERCIGCGSSESTVAFELGVVIFAIAPMLVCKAGTPAKPVLQ